MSIVKIIKEPPTDGTTVYVCGRNGAKLELLGDITLMEDGSAVVMNDWGGKLEFFDTHEEAIWYVKTRICGEEPVYAIG